jgi:hypothetical protein
MLSLRLQLLVDHVFRNFRDVVATCDLRRRVVPYLINRAAINLSTRLGVRARIRDQTYRIGKITQLEGVSICVRPR